VTNKPKIPIRVQRVYGELHYTIASRDIIARGGLSPDEALALLRNGFTTLLDRDVFARPVKLREEIAACR
jgi:hypothetical protein